jgi:hypothetical protein
MSTLVKNSITTIPLQTFNRYQERYTEVPERFHEFMRSIQTGAYGRRALSVAQPRSSNQPPPLKTVIIELFNRLAPDNVARTVSTISTLKVNGQINTAQDVTSVADFIFRYATVKQDYRMALAYANLVVGLADLQIGNDPREKLIVLILGMCREAFVKETQNEFVDRIISSGIAHASAGITSEEMETKSRHFKHGLVQFLAALNEVRVTNTNGVTTGAFNDTLYDRAIADMLACTDTAEGAPYDARIEAAALMASFVSKRYSITEQLGEVAAANMERLRNIAKGKVPGVSSKAKCTVFDFLDTLKGKGK